METLNTLDTFKPTISVPKTPEQELQFLIEATTFVFRHTGGMKSNPLVAIWREGNLNFDWIMKEIELIRQHKSKLSSGQRGAVITLVASAIEQFKKRQANSQDEQSETIKTHKDVNEE